MAFSVDYGDVQGLVRFGFVRMTEACYFLLSIKNAPATRAWLKTAPVTTGVEKRPPPATALQIAFTRQGLKTLSVPHKVMEGFSAEFLCGMNGDENRSRRLCDTGANAPCCWKWGSNGNVPHAVVMLFAEPGKLEAWKRFIRGEFWKAAFEEIECLSTSDMGGVEPFGFIDGISQPDIDWEQTRRVPINGVQLTYGNIVCLGEFLLGYSNEYGKYTDRPLLDPQDPGSDELLPAEDQHGKKDLGLNGTYVVMRQLQQDVRGFWQFLDKVTGADRDAPYMLAKAFIGRSFVDGAPLVSLRKAPTPARGSSGDESKRNLDIQRHQFSYDSDVTATSCPFGAHIRRGNPRNPDILGNSQGLFSKLIHLLGFGNTDIHADLIASTRFHRLLRRGREYGGKLSPEESLQPAPPTAS